MYERKARAPATLSPLLLKVLDQVGQGLAGSGRNTLGPSVAELSRLFTKGRGSLASCYLDNPTNAAAYLTYFVPVNLSKVQMLLDELPSDAIVKEDEAGLRVLDLGSGPGTGALAVLDWLHQSHPELARRQTVLTVDSSADALQQADELWNRYCAEAGNSEAKMIQCQGNLVKSEKERWRDLAKEQAPFDLIILANCINELYLDARDAIDLRSNLITDLLEWLAPHGSLMVLEPAMRDTSRSLHQVRDRLLQEKRCTVYSPCLHEHDCPALIHPDDWCHEERAWEPSASIQAIDQEVGFIKDALKFSYLLLRKDGKTIVERQPDVYRVVSELRELKGEKRAWLCNELGRQEVGRQDRLASSQNEAFDRWHRGAIVQIEKIVRKERDGKVSALGRIERDAVVELIRPV